MAAAQELSHLKSNVISSYAFKAAATSLLEQDYFFAAANIQSPECNSLGFHPEF